MMIKSADRLGTVIRFGRRSLLAPKASLSVLVGTLACIGGSTGFEAHAASPQIPIKHVIIIMQENRSFDHYFGKFPGADGIPAGTCVPYDPAHRSQGCVVPFHDVHDVNAGGPHGNPNAGPDIDTQPGGALMDGYIQQQTHGFATGPSCSRHINTAVCQALADGVARHDVVGYHTRAEIPNYWIYAENFVLQDRLFEGARAASLTSHLYLVSEWAAICSDPKNAMTCVTRPDPPTPTANTEFPWVNLLQLFDLKGLSWKYYIGSGDEPDCEDDQMDCLPQPQQNANTPTIWNPVPFFGWVRDKGPAYLAAHDVDTDQLYKDLDAGALPAVSWIMPSGANSEHPPSGVSEGMDYVTGIINAVMRSSAWNSTAIFLAWDDWGGFYDHVVPPTVDAAPSGHVAGYGIRVPGLLISPYAKKGLIDHQLLSLDSYATFIENVFIDSSRLDPNALGNPDNRPTIRDSITSVKFPDGHFEPVGDLMKEFDFTQKPRPPYFLSNLIPYGVQVNCGAQVGPKCTKSTVTLTWSDVASPSDGLVYHVFRGNTELTNCAGTSMTCTDTPARGPHYYTVYAVETNGKKTPTSAAARADVP